MTRLRRQRVVSIESIVVVVRERGASGMSRAGVEALGLLRCYVRELRLPCLRCGGLVCGRLVRGLVCGCCPLAGAGPAALLCCWIACAVEPVLRRRPVNPSRCLARRTVDSLVAQASLCTLGCPPSCETGSWVPGASGASVLYIDLSTARAGPVGAPVPLACGSWPQIGSFAFWLSAGRRKRGQTGA